MNDYLDAPENIEEDSINSIRDILDEISILKEELEDNSKVLKGVGGYVEYVIEDNQRIMKSLSECREKLEYLTNKYYS